MPLVVPRANVAVSSSVGERTCIVNASDGDGYQSENEGDLDEGEVDFTSVILSEIWRVDFKGGQRLYRVQYDDKSKKDVVVDRFDSNGNANDCGVHIKMHLSQVVFADVHEFSFT